MDAERQDEPLAHGRTEALVGLDEAARLLSHVLDVEHVVQVAVFVADEVKHHVAIRLICIDVVENHQGVTIETSGHGLSCVSVDDVKNGLKKKKTICLANVFICYWM